MTLAMMAELAPTAQVTFCSWLSILVMMCSMVTTATGLALEEGVAIVFDGSFDSPSSHLIDLSGPSSIFKVYAATRRDDDKEIALVYDCESYSQASQDTWLHRDNPDLTCLCTYDQGVVLAEVLDLPLGSCLDLIEMTSQGWHIVEGGDIDRLYIISDDDLDVPDDLLLVDYTCHGDIDPSLNGEFPILTILSDCPPNQLIENLGAPLSPRLLGSPLMNLISIQPHPNHTVMFEISDSEPALALHTQYAAVIRPSRQPCTYLRRNQTCAGGTCDCLVGDDDAPLCAGSSPEVLTAQAFDDDGDLNIGQFTGFHGKKMLVGAVIYQPYVHLENVTWSGFCIDMLEIIASHLNFTFGYVNMQWNFGYIDDKGEWTGSIRAVKDAETDIALTGLTITHIRETAIDFTMPFWIEPTAFLTLYREPVVPLLLRPLSGNVWAALVGVAVLAIVVLCSTENLVAKLKDLPSEGKPAFTYLREVTVYIIGACFFQGGSTSAQAGSTRVNVAFFWMVVIITLATFCANLMASLSITVQNLPFQTLQEIADDDDYLLIIHPYSATRTLFEGATEGVYYELWQKVMRDPENSLIDSAGCLNVFENDRPALCVGDKMSLLVQATEFDGGCNWFVVPEEFFPSGFGIAMPEGTAFKINFDDVIIDMSSSGLLSHLTQKWFGEWLGENECSNTISAEASSVSMDLLWPGFALLAGGLTLATLAFVVEFSYNIFHRKPDVPEASRNPPAIKVQPCDSRTEADVAGEGRCDDKGGVGQSGSNTKEMPKCFNE